MADEATHVGSNKTQNEDIEQYLYGEMQDSKKESSSGDIGKEYSGVEDIKKEGVDDDDEDGEFEESDDDDDDNIQVHIGDVNAVSVGGQYGTPTTWKKDQPTTVKTATLPTQGPKKIDVNAVGLINGQPIYEYDIDADQDEKPWRKPGADISDYFNYGFTEDTWKQYCEKQRRMRMESSRGPYSVTQSVAAAAAQSAQVEIEVLPDGRTRVKAGPPPDRKVEGSIHVLGSDADARRKQKEDELLALALGQSRVIAPQPFPPQRPLYTGPNVVAQGLPPGLQYLPSGQTLPGVGGIGGPPPTQIFQPPASIGMDFPPQDHFVHPGNMPPPFSFGGPNSDSEFDSDGENRRHRRRESSSRHRRHRDRSDRERTGDRDRDRDRDRERERSSKRDKERSSSSRRSRDQSKSSSDRKRHSSRMRNDDEEPSERKSRSRRPKKDEEKKDNIAAPTIDDTSGSTALDIKEEPSGE